MAASKINTGGTRDAFVNLFTGHTTQMLNLESALLEGDTGLFLTSQGNRKGDLIDELAQQLAHRLRGHFEHGVCLINLQGHAPLSHPPVDAAQAQRYLLSQLMAPIDITQDARALNRLYRDTFAQKNVLLLLSNAADAQQIRYLIPRNGAKVIVTSVRDLSSSFPKLQPHFVAGIPSEAAYELLTAVSPRALLQNKRAILKLCDLLTYSPLSIAIIAPLLDDTPHLSPREIINRYQDAKRRIRALHGEAPAVLDCALEMAYDALPPQEQARFAQLAVFPGAFTFDAARVIWNVSQAEAKHTLRALVQRNLVKDLENSEFILYAEIRSYTQNRLLGRTNTASVVTQRYIHYIFQQTLPEARIHFDVHQPLDAAAVELLSDHLVQTWLWSNNQVPGWAHVEIDPHVRLSAFLRLADMLKAVLTQEIFEQWLATALSLASSSNSTHTLAQLEALSQVLGQG